MSTHTPGPWIAECVGSGGDYSNPVDVYEVTNGHARIAEYCTEADARLIAAAPDLLAALRDLVSAEGLPEGYANRAMLIDAARVALAKAEGVA